MRIQTLSVYTLLLLGSSALGQSHEMTIHLKSGETVTIPHAEIRRIELAHIPTGIPDPAEPEQTPHAFRLLRSYPNPFNPSTTIEYEIPAGADVRIRVFDLHGALVKELLHEAQEAGRHKVTWDGTDRRCARVASGVYVYAVECGGRALSRQLILVK